jgi:sugar phosphate isomerase/epimerase
VCGSGLADQTVLLPSSDNSFDAGLKRITTRVDVTRGREHSLGLTRQSSRVAFLPELPGMHTISRRDLLRAGAAAALAAGAAGQPAASAARGQGVGAGRREYCFFSKHLAELNWKDLGKAVKDAGFDGVDLTVRTGGHVLPERAAELPKAIDAIRAAGVTVPMITTELTSAGHPTAKPILQAAAQAGVRYFKTGYWRFTASPDVRGQLAAVGEALSGLAALARECGIELGFHNHNAYVGAALWDIAPAMDRVDPKWAGYYFDPRHAMAEGGGGAYKAATYLVLPRLKMIALKDFFWAKTDRGWRIEDCPMGAGMVDWSWFASTLKTASFSGPISLHFEYEIPGATAAERVKATLAAAVKDLAFSRKVLG